MTVVFFFLVSLYIFLETLFRYVLALSISTGCVALRRKRKVSMSIVTVRGEERKKRRRKKKKLCFMLF